jgi:ABC-type multidrug transport system ATPase subunit
MARKWILPDLSSFFVLFQVVKQVISMLVYDVQGVVKQYSGQAEPANKHISLQIAEGEIFGLLGDNGARKTTLVRQMANLLRSDAGASEGRACA